MKTCIYIFFFLSVILLPVSAQVTIQQYRGQVTVTQKRAERVGNTLELDMNVTLNGLSVGRYQSLLLMPMLRLSRDSLVMAPIVLNGANKQKMYDRALILRGREAAADGAYTVVKNTPLRIEVDYRQSIPYHPWMEKAQLFLVGELCDYQGSPIQTFINQLTERISFHKRYDADRQKVSVKAKLP